MIWEVRGTPWERTLDALKNDSLRFARRALGRDPTGPVFHRIVDVRATSSKDGDGLGWGQRFVYLIEVPETALRQDLQRRTVAELVARRKAEDDQVRQAEVERQQREARQREIEEDVARRNLAVKKAKEEAEQQRLEADQQRAVKQAKPAEQTAPQEKPLASHREWSVAGSIVATSLMSLVLAALCLRDFRARTRRIEDEQMKMTSGESGSDSALPVRGGRSPAMIISFCIATVATSVFLVRFLVTESNSPVWNSGLALLFILFVDWLGTTIQAARRSDIRCTAEVRVGGWIGVTLAVLTAGVCLMLRSGWELAVVNWLILHVPAVLCLVSAPAAAAKSVSTLHSEAVTDWEVVVLPDDKS